MTRTSAVDNKTEGDDIEDKSSAMSIRGACFGDKEYGTVRPGYYNG